MTAGRFWSVVAAVLALATIVYWPALSAPYYQDD
jgi:hypothetical protein